MKLSAKQTARTADEIGANPVPENHPVVTQLARIYGDHTFFVDGEGLEIVEARGAEDGADNAACVVKLASWMDDERTRLAPHEPEATDVVVMLDPEE